MRVLLPHQASVGRAKMRRDKMSRYRVWANAADYGIFEASSAQEARNIGAVIAGYKSEQDMVDQLEQPSEIQAEEVDRAVMLDGHEIDFDAAAYLMDDDLREELHDKMAPCSDQEILDAYVIAHAEKFGGEVFVVN
jgi:hypothetical protein